MAGRTTKQMLFWSLVTLELLVIAACGLAGAWMFRLFFPPCGQPPDDPNVVVIVSACTRPRLVTTSPDGKYMVYYDDRGYWLRNLITGDEEATNIGYWLSDTLALEFKAKEGKPPSYWLYDLMSETHTPIQDGRGSAAFPEALPIFQQAETVYYDPEFQIAIALARDFKTHPEDNYLLRMDIGALATEPEELLVSFLRDHQIPYALLSREYGDPPLPSHDNLFLAKGTRITDLKENNIVIYREGGVGLVTEIAGWAHDDSGVYFQPPLTSGPASVLMPLLVVPKGQPILKLKLPDQYLSPQALEAEKARRAQEQAEQQRATLIRWMVVGVLVLLAIGAVVLVNRWLFK